MNKKTNSNKEKNPSKKPAGKPFKKTTAGPKVKRKAVAAKPEEIRLNRFLANAGISSRREADKLIQSGTVKINGEVVTELGTKVKPGDTVHYGGELIRGEKKQYVLLNKPKGYITTMDDPKNRRTVMELVGRACKERIYPVGRLDRATSGLLLFSNDGALTKRLTHPSGNVKKVYHVTLDKKVTKNHLIQLVEGIELEDGMASVDKAWYFKDGQDKAQINLELHSGRNRIVRRLMEALGYQVDKLDRIQFAGLTKKDLSRGRFRHLTEKEVGLLHRVAGLKLQQND
jgi:23S rRNA pseudouridine2605 synthase